ncbi:MAG: SpoIID/LytB domain-containing protein [Phycisphaerales bacterium]|nr:SpoIID/LytB domain-containing protein [Phycisphaerales bacterium]
MNNQQAPDIRSWRTTTGREPVVRIGVVLDVDEMSTVHMRLPEEDYDLVGKGSPTRTLRDARIEARVSDGTVLVRIDDGVLERAPIWRIVPRKDQPIVRGAGALVRDIVAGRGFHWRKLIDQRLTGVLELRAGSRGLILVNEIPLEPYLAGVITSEMGAECPVEFLKAQCVVARSWLLALTEDMHDGEPFDRCNDDCCQRYQGTDELSPGAIEATVGTRGLALLDEKGGVVDANYSKSCGGISELPEHVWGITKPGLTSIIDAPPGGPESRFSPVTGDTFEEYLSGAWLDDTKVYCSPNIVPPAEFARYLGKVDEGGDYFRWEISMTRAELEETVRTHVPEAVDFAKLTDLRVEARGVSGRATKLTVVYDDAKGEQHQVLLDSEYRIRQALHPGFLYSSAIAIATQRDADGDIEKVTCRGAGWGHGAGLCQIGALGMGLCNIENAAILKHYFPTAKLKTVYP